ncbi:cobN/Magnesium Chelatase family protein [Mycobacterium xenopi 3993]|nr:cobN/Magnesium Chelatase family protein [Mycobacterium xenopi 3993]
MNLEPIPLTELGRPRIDVTVRISGFFRDAFPHVVTMLDDAVRLVADLDEPFEHNYVRPTHRPTLPSMAINVVPPQGFSVRSRARMGQGCCS